MTTKRLLVVYYTGKGGTKMMAEEIGKGAERPEVKVQLKRVEECGLKDLEEADGIVVGSPTYFSNVAWQVKKLIDESIKLYRENRSLKDKVGGCFTSSGTRRDGEDCVRTLELAFGLHHRVNMVPGIVCTSGDGNKTSETCRKYGKKIARKMIS